VLREDHVFAALLALMALQIVLDLVSGSWALQILGICYAVIFFGVVTFQRWAHTAAVWLMGMGLLGSLLNLFGLALLPILALQFAVSDLAIARSWLFWFIATGTYVFVLVVLMERRAYFEGVHARVPPKRRRLKDVLASAKKDLKPIDPYERRAPVGDESPQTTAAERRSQPSAYDPMAETPAAQRTDAPPPAMPTVSEGEAAREGRTPAAHDGWQQAASSGVTCTRCGNEFARGLPACPHCAAAAPAAGAPPAATGAQAPPGHGPTEGVALPPRQESDDRYRVEPMKPAPGQAGQDWIGVGRALSWAHIRDLARQDRVFGTLLALLVLQALMVVASGKVVAIIGALAIIWGILILNVWAYWGALIISAMLALWHLRLLAQADEIAGTGGMVLFGAIAAMNLMIVGLLLARRERFG
jgi:hypothetical protein